MQKSHTRRDLIAVENLLDFAQFSDIIDVRSAGEFAEDHIPNAQNCPVLNDAERAYVGTLYVQDSAFAARKIGAVYVAKNIAQHLENSLNAHDKNWQPLIMCWRGGQRSGALTHILRSIGFDAKQLIGGYKSYRKLVISALNELPPKFSFIVIGGKTGSGKSHLLGALAQKGQQVLELEKIACHKGSVLGVLPNVAQPSQKSFESQLAQQLLKFSPDKPVFIEAESRKIGALQIPEVLLTNLRAGRFLSVDAPMSERIPFLMRDYAYFLENSDPLIDVLNALIPMHGKAKIADWCALIHAKNWEF